MWKRCENDRFNAALLLSGSLSFGGTEGRRGGGGGRRVNAGGVTSGPAALTPGVDVPVYGLRVERREEKKKYYRVYLMRQAVQAKECCSWAFSHPEAAEAVEGQVKGSAVTAEQFLDGFLLLR